MKHFAIVTGTTSGIGKATAYKLASLGYNLIITGRRQERLNNLKSELTSQGIKVYDLCFDIRNNNEVEKAFYSLPEDIKIDVLVNNAGLAAGADPVQNGLWSDWD